MNKPFVFLLAILAVAAVAAVFLFLNNQAASPAGTNGDESSAEFKCLPEQRQGEVCIELYDPVCAKVNVQCIKDPCPPIRQTFPNSCQACINPLVESYVKGECEE